jgi:uncharacterized protein YprB with RNaseH-like and TPR domain
MITPPPSRWYGLDIETDTTLDGLDATVAAIVAVAVSTADEDFVLQGEELQILTDLEELVSSLAPGVLITWNGNYFDLPFIAERAARGEVALGLRFGPGESSRWPAAKHTRPYSCSWGEHRHLDGYQLYRADLGRQFRISCGLKALSRMLGLAPVEVDRTQIHLLSEQEMHEYVASDARLARELVGRRMPVAFASCDLPVLAD